MVFTLSPEKTSMTPLGQWISISRLRNFAKTAVADGAESRVLTSIGGMLESRMHRRAFLKTSGAAAIATAQARAASQMLSSSSPTSGGRKHSGTPVTPMRIRRQSMLLPPSQ